MLLICIYICCASDRFLPQIATHAPQIEIERLKCFKHFGLGSLPVNSSSAWTFSRISVWSLSRISHFDLDSLPVNRWCYVFFYGKHVLSR
ncbi:hypothetical protein RIR_jg19191.t1 [Rhizophagus irregularis DAOM 181602=DAOM 197198]|nr:hypothetical protein RIR_jg19191.t1 [Rhizophagus irregularis DAOM 181602=DAOM 197198]